MDQESAPAPGESVPGAVPGAVPMPAFLPPRLLPQAFRRQDPSPVVQDEETQETAHERTVDEGVSYADVPVDKLETGPSPASTAKAPRAFKPLATPEQIKAAKSLVGAILMGATGLLNRKVAMHDNDRRWLMSPSERDAVAAPLARILARRSPVSVEGESASDLADGIEAIAALLAFSIEQMQAEPDPAPVVLQPVEQVVQTAPAPAAVIPVRDSNPFAPQQFGYPQGA